MLMNVVANEARLSPITIVQTLDGGVEEMSLHPGTRLGPHEVVALIGAGGMGSACGPREARSGRARAAGSPARGLCALGCPSGGGAPRAVKNDRSFALWPC